MTSEAVRPEHVLFPKSVSDLGDETEAETGSTSQPKTVAVTSETGVIVVVGANGSGKSRLGAWIDTNPEQGAITHRVAAQRVLEIPATIFPKSFSQAEDEFLYGSHRGTIMLDSPGAIPEFRHHRRWRGNPTIVTLNDYEQLLAYLFTDHNLISAKYLEEAQSTQDRVEPPITRLQRVKGIWESALPHRRLEIGSAELHTFVDDVASRYPAQEMSDGERVVFYLAGECLAARPGSILIIDEPEIHLHRAIQARLWDAIEQARRDCMFVYLTHDLEFAATRAGATKIVVEDYDGAKWRWSPVNEVAGIPEPVMLQIAGSRKPILFCEGDTGSLDQSVYSHVFPEYTIIPIGSCENVIHATATFRNTPGLHRFDAVGLIDRDQRTGPEIARLETKYVFALSYAAIENLFLAPPVIEFAARCIAMPNVSEVVHAVARKVLTYLDREREAQVLKLTARHIERLSCGIGLRVTSESELDESVREFQGSLRVQETLMQYREAIDRIIREQDYPEALRFYIRKGLSGEISTIVGLSGGGYQDLVLRYMRSEKAS